VQESTPGARHQIIPNFLSLPVIEPVDQAETSQELKIIFIGRIHPVKNLELLLDTLCEFKSVPWTLKIVGEGNAEYVDRLKTRYSEDVPIHWMGAVDGMQKFRILRDADLLVLMSHTENFANVVIESLSQGTPVLISDTVGLSDYVRKHRLGWVIHPSQQKLLQTLNRLGSQESTRKEIRSRAPAIIRNDFNPEHLVMQYIRMYTNKTHSNGEIDK
jgi:glycosyltransferase involved in cell wall biosynthesis